MQTTAVTAAATYVAITREELEEWLTSLPGSWEREPKRAGIYYIIINDTVAIRLSSTIGSRDEVMGRGDASMSLALISRLTLRSLNSRAQGQTHFNRTVGWKKNWATGVARVREAYDRASPFYDALSVIEDRDRYRIETLATLRAIPGGETNPGLQNYIRKVDSGEILVASDWDSVGKIREFLAREKAKAPSAPSPEGPSKKSDDPKVVALRDLYRAVKRGGNQWEVDFVASIGKQIADGRRLSPKQVTLVIEKLKRESIRLPNGDPAETLFQL